MPDYALHTSGSDNIDASENHSSSPHHENTPVSGSLKHCLSAAFIRYGEWYVGLLFVAMFFFSSGCIYYSASENFLPLLITNAVLTVICAVVAVLFIRCGRKHILKIVEEGVYDAILAGVDVIDAKFFLIIDTDGKLIHADAQYKKYFGDPAITDVHCFADFLAKGVISASDQEAVSALLASDGAGQVVFTVETAAGEKLALILTVKSVDIGAALKYSGSLQKAYMLRKCFHGRQKCFLIKAMAGEVVQDSRKQFLDNLPVGVYAATDSGELSYHNKALSAMLGYEQSDTLPLGNIREWLVVPESNTDSPHVVMQIRKKEGEMVQVLSRPLWGGEQQGKKGTYTMVMQVQPLKESSSSPISRENNDDTLTVFLESAPIAQMILTEKGDIEQSNAVFHTLVGGGSAAGEALNLLNIISEKSKQEVEAYIARAAEGEPLKPLDVQIAGEKEVTALLYMKCLSGKKEGEKRLIGHLVDTTEQKNLELRFVHSQKMQAVGQLAGGIAHDFNNLLTAMIGFCDLLLLRHPAGDQSFADLMQIKQNTNRAANLVRQLLAFSRKQTLQPEILDITVVLAELSSLVRRLIGENIDLKVHHGQDLWLVKVDQGQLDQVMINLAVNARDAMNGSGALTIKSSNVTVESGQLLRPELIPPAEDEIIVPGNYVLIEVIDTGSGIPKTVLGKIFEPFFSTKEVGSGTGLGLSTVYGIVKQTGGYIYVTSKEGQGTTFSIFLKGYDKSLKEDTGTNEAVEKSAITDLTGNGIILLVEDETPVRIFSSHALTNKGYTVLEASSGESALSIIAERGNEINVIITDVIMPGMNGPAMIEEIAEKYPNIKVIFISGYAEDIFIKTYGTERKFNFLPKPFTLKQLAGKVKEVMSNNPTN